MIAKVEFDNQFAEVTRRISGVRNDIHNADDSIFPDQRFMVQRLNDEGHQAVLMLPGSIGAFDTNGVFRVEHLSGVSSVQDVFANKEAYLRRYATEWAGRVAAEKASWEGPRSDLLPDLKAWFEAHTPDVFTPAS